MKYKYCLAYTLLLILLFTSVKINPSFSRSKLSLNYYNNKNSKIKSNFPPSEILEYTSKINNILIKYRFNGNIMVVKNGDIIFKKSRGYSNLKTKTPLNENSVFQLASVSKQFTAMAIMILFEQGKLKYDDPVVKYIPDFPYKKITIKHLLSHTSGIPNYFFLINTYWPKNKSITYKDVLTLFKQHRPNPNFPPGSRFLYSNTGYVFLGMLTEKISGLPFSSFLSKHIFDPLGMENTFVYDRDIINSIPNRTYGYQVGKKYIKPIYDDITDELPGDKGIFSTIDDLYKWDKALYQHILVKETTINEAYQEATLNNNQTCNYGYGWRIKDDNGLRIIYHNGWWHGYKTSITRFIEDRNTIILLNNTNSHIKGIINDVKKVLYPEAA